MLIIINTNWTVCFGFERRKHNKGVEERIRRGSNIGHFCLAGRRTKSITFVEDSQVSPARTVDRSSMKVMRLEE
jgi:hypothetical protein